MDSSNHYEFTCANCGKVHRVAFRGHCAKKFCNTACMEEYREKKRKADADEAKAAKAEKVRQKSRIVQKSKCKRCKYSTLSRDEVICCYFEITGHTRLGLHPEGLNANCREFQSKTENRNKALSVR